jgi:hypothetical protein
MGMIRAAIVDVGECLVDETREYGTWCCVECCRDLVQLVCQGIVGRLLQLVGLAGLAHERQVAGWCACPLVVSVSLAIQAR